MKHSLRAFKHPNFRLFFAGQSISLVGTWIHTMAMSWMVYRLSGSAFLLGLTGFASMAPIFFFSPLGGLLADRLDRRKLLIVTQSLAGLHAVIMAVLAFADMLNAWHVIALAAVIGMIQAADTPLRQTFLPELVPAREDLPSAVAFGAFMQQSGRLIGPTIAGLILVRWSEAACFLVNAISKIAVITAVVVMHLPRRPQSSKPKKMGSAFAEGVRYAWQTIPVRILLPILAAASFLVAPYQSLMPIFAAEIFHGGAETLGWLMGAAGIGGAASVVALASRKDVRGLARIIFIATITAGLGLVAFSATRWFWLGMLLMPLIGAGMLAIITGTSTVLQVIVDDDKRGRVMSLYTMSFLGMMPMGSLAAGIVAEFLGAPLTLGLFGATCCAAALVYGSKMPVLRAHMREHYVRLGIIKE